MKRTIVIVITFVVGLYYLLEFVLPPHVGGDFDCRSMGSPCLVAADDGYRLYYTGLRKLKGGTDDRLAIGLAESENTTAWVKADDNPLLGRSMFRSKDWRGVDSPAVVREPDGTYTMFCIAHGADGSDRIMRSTSSDGQRWHGRRVVFTLAGDQAGGERSADQVTISALAVLRVKSDYVAYFASTYLRDSRKVEGVSRATSEDGLTWALDEANNPVIPIEPENGWTYTFITDLSALETEDGFRLYYAGTKTYVLDEGKTVVPVTLVGLATSDDGISWERHPGNPVFGPAVFRLVAAVRSDPGVAAALRRLRDARRSPIGPRQLSARCTAAIRLARELGKGTAIRAAAAQITPDGRPLDVFKRFDAQNLSGVSVIYQDGRYTMAYGGSPALDRQEYQIGMVASNDGIAWRTTSDAPALELGSDPTSTYLSGIYSTVAKVFIVIGAMAVGLGLFGLASLHGTRVIKRQKGMAYSLAFFLSLVFTLIIAFKWGQEDPKVVTEGHKLYDIIFKGLMTSFGASSMGLLSFYLASASYRSFKLKNAEAALMMVAAILVMLGQVPLGQLLTAWFPEHMAFLRVQNVTFWIQYTIQVPTMRAIQVGAAVGGLVLATRLWLSMDKRRD